ncbi:methyltransferase [Corynebacterium renale]|uniref:class I SAM-dependent methyltransferase n=1 Tax=Corynebacterium renale TaxID=1724 RepID=UPI000DA38E32|nr:class I SAM-dependent methyltransferase [Corynebacterium renale]SQG64084.1 methyltransferase [Corynebacterium renale]STC94293.1 methyltransferase [Corynebacterium renale]
MGVGAAVTFFEAGADYAAFRPTYPADVVKHIRELAPQARVLIDVGAGTGQLTAELQRDFPLAVGVDPSLSQAHAAGGVPMVVATAESLPFATESVDVITVAQAIHWVDVPAFLAEARRVARPGALLWIVSYGVAQLDPGGDLEQVFSDFYWGPFHRFWEPQRSIVDDELRSVEPLIPGAVREEEFLDQHMTCEQFVGYLNTWSSARSPEARSELDAFVGELSAHWTDGQTRLVRWPLTVLHTTL